MGKVAHTAPKKEESEDIEALLSNEFASGVIKGIKEFKAGRAKPMITKKEFLNSLRNL